MIHHTQSNQRLLHNLTNRCHRFLLGLAGFTSLLGLVGLAGTLTSPVIAKEVPAAGLVDKAVAKRSQALLVQPVILCDDDGKNPARYALPKKLVDQAYTKADLEFLYLDPVHWNNSQARQGKINLNTIVQQGHANGMISKDPRITTLLFVSAVDGNAGPLGRGLQNGNICFVSLGPKGKMANPAERAFVVAHEVGHCLGLLHTVDDPAVPDDIPNLQGAGPFDQRLAAAALHPTQVKTILASPLSIPRRQYLSAKETGKYLTNGHWDTPCHGLSDHTVCLELALKPDDHDIPKDAAKRTDFVKTGYDKMAIDFTEDDIKLLNDLIDSIEEKLAGDWPAMTRLPWNFAKMKTTFCNGHPHTRGITIVLTDRFMLMAKASKNFGMGVLLHEKLHVIQRLFPERFKKRYVEYGFKAVTLPDDTMVKLNLVRNPDAADLTWAIQAKGAPWLIATTLKTFGEQTGMAPTLHALTPVIGKPYTHSAGPDIKNKEVLDQWGARFPIRMGLEDPRELSAYLMMYLFRTDYLGDEAEEMSEKHKAVVDAERKSLKAGLRFGPGA